MTPRYFVTGTDTGVGKTQVSAALLRLMVKRGHRPFAFKPFESGMASLDAPGDGLALQQAGGAWQPLETVSLFRFKAPLAPAMAAKRERRATSWRAVRSTFQSFGDGAGVVEGAGGLRVPLDSRHDVIDAIEALKLPVVVVARSALGTINHTTLTLEALAARRLRVAAVVMVSSQPTVDPSVALNKAELEARFPRVRFLGPVPFLEAALLRARAFERALSTLV
ncbi:MAG: dethiobiotin synthase [Archangiaceae bacterium]|nr:dethiobiotin synthase [Archangiaceae bacterium]